MNLKSDLKLAYGLAIVLFVIAVLSYAAFPSKPPEEPIRMMFKATAGRVLFDHKTHNAPSGYAISCSDCHHHPYDGSDLRACGDCHLTEIQDVTEIESCQDCHEADEIEGMEILPKADAFHGQCIDCHKAAGSGPMECSACHVI